MRRARNSAASHFRQNSSMAKRRSSTPPVRSLCSRRVKGPGYWVFAPARLAGGSIILINRGFVPDDRKDPAARAETTPHGIVDFVGVMRWPEKRNSFMPPDDPDKGVWYLRYLKFDRCSQEVGATAAPFYSIRKSRCRPAVFRKPEARSAFDRQSPAVCYHLVSGSRWRSPGSMSSGSRAVFLGGNSVSCESACTRLLCGCEYGETRS